MHEGNDEVDLFTYCKTRLASEKRKRESIESTILPFVSSAVGTAHGNTTSTTYERRWIDRINTSHYPPSSFTFEISFHNSNPLGLNLRPHFIPFGNVNKLLGCCVILEVIPALEAYIHPGDILLKLNDVSLLGGDSSSSSFNFDATTKLISATSSPRVIKFMRISGLAYNLLSSPAEVISLAEDSNVSAKLTCVPGDPTSNQPVNVQIVSVDNQVRYLPFVNYNPRRLMRLLPYVASCLSEEGGERYQGSFRSFADRAERRQIFEYDSRTRWCV
jgi:hypothetical protein